MNNCNKCYYNSYLHDKYIINKCHIKTKYKNYKLNYILQLDIFIHKHKFEIINKLKVLIINRKKFKIYFIEDIYDDSYTYSIYTKVMYNNNIPNGYYYNNYIDINNKQKIIKILSLDQLALEINIIIDFSNFYKEKILNDYLHQWTLHNIYKKEYNRNIWFYKNCLFN